MSRPLKNLLTVCSFVLVTAVALVVVLRSTRKAVGEPQALRDTITTIANGHVALTAARVKDGIVLFDTGQDPKGRALLELLTSMHAQLDDVRDIFLTHGHGDHLAGAPLLKHARIWAGADDVDLAAGKTPPQEFLPRLFGWIFQPPEVHISQPLKGIVDVPVGGLTDVRCFPVPGHTPGSYAYLYARILFVGDTVTLEDGALKSPTFDPHPEANRKALRKLNDDLAASQVGRICTAHGGCTEGTDGRALFDTFVNALPAD